MSEGNDKSKNITDGEAEVPVESEISQKLDRILDLLRENEREHKKIRDELREIRTDLNLLRAGYQQHGKLLGEITSALNGDFKSKEQW